MKRIEKHLWLLILLSCGVCAQPGMDADDLLDESEYRSELEEIVVVGTEPEWRKAPTKEWRPDKFKLSSNKQELNRQWFPEYTKEDRDNYNGVRNRMGEKAEIKIFEWEF
ncbi:hypothetical protein [Oceanicoccus sp. KOV_DT_Chl]|uniref:hypothetical protein n=1 Tax=Oceanicoccus sp. KOV_DT_Chl TaxID=1904639 RepID=UPI000C7DE3C8|nr:hypothetical protein [Oceanicoccus sp. KOV_DT_Chl]